MNMVHDRKRLSSLKRLLIVLALTVVPGAALAESSQSTESADNCFFKVQEPAAPSLIITQPKPFTRPHEYFRHPDDIMTPSETSPIMFGHSYGWRYPSVNPFYGYGEHTYGYGYEYGLGSGLTGYSSYSSLAGSVLTGSASPWSGYGYFPQSYPGTYGGWGRGWGYGRSYAPYSIYGPVGPIPDLVSPALPGFGYGRGWTYANPWIGGVLPVFRGWGSGLFSPFGGGSAMGKVTPSRVVQDEPSKASGNYYGPSTVDTTASGSYYAQTDSTAIQIPIKRQSSPSSYWGNGGYPFPKNLNSVPWSK